MSKKSKKCLNNKSKRLLWYAYTTIGLGVRAAAALALIAISIKAYPLKNQAKSFNACVLEIQETGMSISTAVNFCNGGGD